MGLSRKHNKHADNQHQQPGSHGSLGSGYVPRRPFAKVPSYTQVHATASKAGQKLNPAVELIRRKLDELYAKEPNPVDEIKLGQRDNTAQPPLRSKHQQFMLG